MLPHFLASSPTLKIYNTHDTGVIDSGASNVYFAKEALIQQFNAAVPKELDWTTTSQVQRALGTGTLALNDLPSDFPYTGHVMPLFKYNLIGIGSKCDADWKFFLTKQAVVVYNPQQQPIITGWQEPTGTKI